MGKMKINTLQGIGGRAHKQEGEWMVRGGRRGHKSGNGPGGRGSCLSTHGAEKQSNNARDRPANNQTCCVARGAAQGGKENNANRLTLPPWSRGRKSGLPTSRPPPIPRRTDPPLLNCLTPAVKQEASALTCPLDGRRQLRRVDFCLSSLRRSFTPSANTCLPEAEEEEEEETNFFFGP